MQTLYERDKVFPVRISLVGNMTEVPISQAYQLIIGRVVACEDRQELLERTADERWAACDEGVEHRMMNGQDIEKLEIRVDALMARMDDMWDAVLDAFGRMEVSMPAKKTRASYPAHNGPDGKSREPPGGF